jgi:hypothetical protein
MLNTLFQFLNNSWAKQEQGLFCSMHREFFRHGQQPSFLFSAESLDGRVINWQGCFHSASIDDRDGNNYRSLGKGIRPLSPVLMNIYLHNFDDRIFFLRTTAPTMRYARYADDLLIALLPGSAGAADCILPKVVEFAGRRRVTPRFSAFECQRKDPFPAPGSECGRAYAPCPFFYGALFHG